MEKFGWSIVVVSIFLFSALLVGISNEKSVESLRCSSDIFLSEYVAYVYTSQNDTINVPIYWCPSKVGKNVSVVLYLPFFNAWVNYDKSSIRRGFRGYFKLQVPMPIMLNHSRDIKNLSLDVLIRDSNSEKNLIIPFGNWSFEISKKNPYKLVVVEHREEVFTPKIDTAFITYGLGLLNPTNTTVYIMNLSYSLSPSKVSTIAVACYNVTSISDLPWVNKIEDIPKDLMLSNGGCPILPGKRIYVLVYMKVDPSVRMLLLRPKIIYRIGNRTESMPGGTMSFIRIPEMCECNFR
ncbi:hypothetical protein ADU37_CDS09150 [Thermococcus sp. 2319x1]|uniref:hypothetical protein n=1 Tax=Thermococcus sp. 2319x1 TaxID=1674923 RepID=UPI00073A7728|nr:hypothetical protein [Thermococcus sp. 2319x1]ALV62614.1 hypothetical protein ADU37_CDS09150 [Thermococcus sp. 2319x1]